MNGEQLADQRTTLEAARRQVADALALLYNPVVLDAPGAVGDAALAACAALKTADAALKDALPSDLLAIVNTDSFAKRLGWLFKRHVGTRYGSEQWSIERTTTDGHSKVARWRVALGA